MRTFLIFLCLVARLWGNDCAPETLHAFSRVLGLPSDKAKWFIECKPDTAGTELPAMLSGWAKLQPTKPLVVLYSTDTLLDSDEAKADPDSPLVKLLGTLRTQLAGLPREDLTIHPTTPLVWVGTYQGGWHTALIYIHPDRVQMVHPNTIDPDTDKPYTEFIPLSTFFPTTFVILGVKS
jgi:hypothetical protein